MNFKLKAGFKPTGDQPRAIETIINNLNKKNKFQTLLGVTGSGKTFTMANVIARHNRPSLIISHNKTLAAQLYQEFRDFFPANAVSYFVSYYDYYQPEAYIPQTDTYIEKEAEINEEIDKLRLLATTNLLNRKDVIIVASVSCIYSLGSPRQYARFILELKANKIIQTKSILEKLTDLQYQRDEYSFKRGTFRVRGESIDLFEAYSDTGLHIEIENGRIDKLYIFDPLTGNLIKTIKETVVYPAKHYMTDPNVYQKVFPQIREELREQTAKLKERNKPLEANRLKQRVNFDLEMIQKLGYVNGIENYSRYFDNREIGEPPFSLLDYFEQAAKDWLLFIDESHITMPQIRGMYNGDRARKETLIDFGFRLPSALDNRPLRFDEFMRKIPQAIFVSATPNDYELSLSKQSGSNPAEQLIRPTGLVDPVIVVKKTKNQIEDLIAEIKKRAHKNQRVLVTTLTKRMAEDLSGFLQEKGIKVSYLHSDITTLERQDILDNLRKGDFDVIVGINLLREGLDLPEVSLVAILDADKEGFLRSKTSLIQTMGRAARNAQAKVILYADCQTNSMQEAIKEVRRRRRIQLEYNKKHHIKPKSIEKKIRARLIEEEEKKESLDFMLNLENKDVLLPDEKELLIKRLRAEMKQAAGELDFETAALLRDKIKIIKTR
ncbi:MAG: excinuclease ABC subunit UvrB [Patescibacteria group bacterium]|nr:excinuclease ABC subunit UvrB [Patescibacteria group bacterium]